MTLHIPSSEAEALATEVARLTGETRTDAVTRALRDRLLRIQREQAGRPLADELDEIALQCAALPERGSYPPEEVVSYDADGLPV